MIEFEWYIKRARIDLNLLFKVENINSDEELADYCKAKSLSLPKNRYFPEKEETTLGSAVEEIKNNQEVKPKRTRRKPASQLESKNNSETEPKKEKTVRKPRRNTRKKVSDK